MEATVVELDLRQIPVWDRHERIFQEWDALQTGQTLRIINDHDPKPLFYEFRAERGGEFEWTPLERGPETWSAHRTAGCRSRSATNGS